MAVEHEVSKSKAPERAGKKRQKEACDRKKWKAPSLEDVSGKVMAQPYIRFT